MIYLLLQAVVRSVEIMEDHQEHQLESRVISGQLGVTFSRTGTSGRPAILRWSPCFVLGASLFKLIKI